jgi:hypothetical protein
VRARLGKFSLMGSKTGHKDRKMVPTVKNRGEMGEKIPFWSESKTLYLFNYLI